MAYIEREKAKELIKNFGKGAIEDGQYALDSVDDIILLASAVDLIPAVDAVEVVRCKDCTEWDEKEGECSHWYGFRENDFCSFGERK